MSSPRARRARVLEPHGDVAVLGQVDLVGARDAQSSGEIQETRAVSKGFATSALDGRLWRGRGRVGPLQDGRPRCPPSSDGGMAGDLRDGPTGKVGIVVERKHRVVQERRFRRVERLLRDARQQRMVKVDGHRPMLAVAQGQISRDGMLGVSRSSNLAPACERAGHGHFPDISPPCGGHGTVPLI